MPIRRHDFSWTRVTTTLPDVSILGLWTTRGKTFREQAGLFADKLFEVTALAIASSRAEILSAISNVDERMQAVLVPLYPYHATKSSQVCSPVKHITSCCAQNLSSRTLNTSINRLHVNYIIW